MPLSYDEYKEQFGRDFAAGDSYAKPYGWADRAGAAVDSAQAGLLGVGEAAGLDWGDARRRNQYDSETVRAAAVRDTGAPERIKDINSFGSLAKGIGGLAVDSAPQLGASIAAGVATGGWGLGLSTVGRLASGAAAGAPFNMGDILQNQRQEAGQTDLLSATALTVPYTAADMLGLDSAIATGKFARTGLKTLDDMKGPMGYAARGAANTGINALAEGTGETLQEFANQAGRMSVNPNQTFFNPDANERYEESFLAGGLLGGAISAPFSMGRSAGYQPPLPADTREPGTDATTQSTDLLTPTNGLPYAPISDAEIANMKAENLPQQTAQGAPMFGNEMDFTSEGVPPVGTRLDPAGGLQMPTVPGRPGLADTMTSGPTTEVAATDADNMAMQDPGTIEAMRRYQQQVAERQAVEAEQAKGAEEAKAKHQRMVDAGVDPANKPQNKFFTDAEAAVAKGAITPEFFHQLLGQVKAGVDPANLYASQVKTAVAAVDKIAKDAQKTKDTQAANTKTAAAEEQAGLIPVGGAEIVNAAIAAGHSGKEALVAQRKAQADALKLAKAEAAMAETTPNAAPKPSTAKVVESKPAAPAPPADTGSAPASAGTATKPAAAAVAPTAGTNAVPVQPAAPAAAAPKAVKKARVVAPGTLTGKPAEVAKPADTITDEYEAMKEKRRKRKENAEALAGGKPIPHPDVDAKLHSGTMSSEDLEDALVAAKYHIRNGMRSFSDYTQKMVSDFGDAIKPYLRRMFTDAHTEEKSKRTEIDLSGSDGKPTVAVSKDAQGNETKLAVKMVGKNRSAIIDVKDGQHYLTALTHSTGSVKGKDFKMHSTPLEKPVHLGGNREDALQALPYAAAEAGMPATKDKKEVKAKKEGAGLDNSGRPDFSKVNAAYADNPVWNLAIRFYMGVDEFGNPLEEQMAQESAARMAAEQLGKPPLSNSQAQVSKALKALGFDADVRKAFWAEQTSVEPMPGYAAQAEALHDEAQAAVELYAKRDGLMDEVGDGTERGAAVAVDDEANSGDNLDSGEDENSARKEYIGSGFNTDRSGNGGVRPNSVANDPVVSKVLDTGIADADTALLVLAGEVARKYVHTDHLTGSETARVAGYARENSAFTNAVYEELRGRPEREVLAGIRATKAYLQSEGEMFADTKDAKKGTKNANETKDTGPVADSREQTANPFASALDELPDSDGAVGEVGEDVDAEGDTGQNNQDGSVTVTVNGKSLEFGDGKSAVAALDKRLERFKSLLDCLKG